MKIFKCNIPIKGHNFIGFVYAKDLSSADDFYFTLTELSPIFRLFPSQTLLMK